MVRRLSLVIGVFGIAIAIVIAVGALALMRGGMSARTEPTRLEGRLARTIRTLAVPSEIRAATNPIPASPRVVEAGLEHFADHCASCHGNDGSGRTAVGLNLYPRAPDMRRPETQTLTDGEIFYIIEHGVRFTGMPAWGGRGAAEESWHLVHFIRHLPMLTDEERARMEALNPKSPDEWRALEAEESFLRGKEPPAHPTGHGGHAH
jgi:mono/diheme cytochrome c family protein